MLKQKINLRMASQDAAPIINLVQNDTGREIECNILDFDIPAGAISKLWLIKPSKKISSCDGVISENMVTVALTDQVVAEKGMCVAQLKITKDGKTLSSFTMYFNFEEDTSTNGIISQEDIKLVETFIQEQKKKLDAYLEGKGQDIEKLKKDMPTKLDKNQGKNNENKFMRVGADGNLIPDDVPIPDVSGQIKEHNENTDSHQDIRAEVKKKANSGTTLFDYGITDAVPDSHLTDSKAHEDIRKETAKLKEDLNKITKEIRSTNMFDESSMIKSTNGWYHPAIAVGSTATITTASGYSAIAMPISGAGKYTFGADAKTSGVTRLYNYVVTNDKNIVIEKATVDKWINKGDDHVTITVSDDKAAYLLLSIYDFNEISGRNVRLNYGDTFLPYEPYFHPYLSVSDSVVSDLDKRISARRVINILKSDNDIIVLNKMISAYQQRNTDVFFEKGIYTLSDMYDYIRNELNNKIAMALPIGNGCRYFMNGSTIMSNAPADGYSDARNVLDCQNRGSDYEIYDATLVNNGGRYCVHDEGASDAIPYFHKYSNVRMYINDGVAAFGSGVGFDASMTFDGCSFISNKVGEFPFFIHAATNNPENKCNKLYLIMKNSYINSGTIGLNLFDKSRDNLEFYLFGNIFKQKFENEAVNLIAANNIVLNG